MGQRVESTIDRVTVFLGAARVTRVTRATITGRTELEVAGLPLGLDDDSLQVAVDGPARAADLRVTVEVTSREEATVDDAELRRLRRAAVEAATVREQFGDELAALSSMVATARAERDLPAPAWTDALTARLAVLDVRAARELEVRAALATAERRVVDAEQALSVARERQARASSAALQAGDLRKVVVITVEPDGAGGEVTLRLGYTVDGALWAPSYAVRLDGAGGATFELRASVVQATGEDWSGVQLEVSTAVPGRWLDLPELPARRIGRRQPTPKRPGWRPPPDGVDGLFADFDRGPQPSPPDGGEPRAPEAPEPTPRRKPDLTLGVPMAAPVPPSMAAPAMSAPMRGAPGGVRRSAESLMEMAGGAAMAAKSDDAGFERSRKPSPVAKMKRAAVAPSDDEGSDEDDATLVGDLELEVGAQLLLYGRLRMAGPREPRRGRLVPMPLDPVLTTLAIAAARARAMHALPPLPAGLRQVERGAYDHTFPSPGRRLVPSDGTWHNLALSSHAARITLGHVVVPSVALEVYRQASFANPLDAPALAGPVDVYDRGELLTTTTIDTTAPGATLELGLGVDATIKVARNARFREEAAGMLRGALRLLHEVAIEVENLGPRPVQLEIRERVPIPAAGTDDVEVEIDRVSPAWEPWRPEPAAGEAPLRGGHRLAPAARRSRAEHARGRLPRPDRAEARAGRRQPEGAMSDASITVALPIADVVVFEDRARVLRRGPVTLAPGAHRLVVSPVSPVVVDKTMVARLVGGAGRVHDLQVRREVAPWRTGEDDPRAAAGERAALEARVEAARERRRTLTDEAAAAVRASQRLAGLAELARAELLDEASWGRQVRDAGPRLAELADRARDAAVRAATLALDAEDAGAELAALEAELAERERVLGREIAVVMIEVDLDEAAPALQLELEYVVPAACWRPAHVATLRGTALEFATDACVWQATGEDWREVRLRCSTERPSLGTRPPTLVDDRLMVQARGALVVSARDQEIVTTGLGAERREAVEVPGVDDGGLARTLAAPLAVSVPGDGRPYRVRLATFTAEAELARVAFPEKAAVVIVRSRQVNAGAEPLLAGPVELIAAGGLTGRTSIKFVAVGERFDLGWGPDPALRLHRAPRSKREAAGILSWATVTHRVALRLSNLGPEPRTVQVTERIPVSEVEKVEVALSAPEAWRLEDDDDVRRDPTPLVTARTVDRDGLITWTVELPARGQRAIALEYVIKAHDSVSGAL